MKRRINLFWSITIVAVGIFCSSCRKELSDAERVAALKNVVWTFSGMTFSVNLPANALSSGLSFDSLMSVDSATYANPANYSIDFIVNMLADNTRENAEDAKFDGMIVNLIMDTLDNVPISTTANAFELLKNTGQQVVAEGGLNLSTHKLAGLYIFRQMVDGADLATTLSPILNYSIGSLNGVINVPDIHQQIPTTASIEMKNFLNGLLDSGVFSN
ncbi:MAG: hypothetical protein V1904_02640 [Bacteroidota bacterium]